MECCYLQEYWQMIATNCMAGFDITGLVIELVEDEEIQDVRQLVSVCRPEPNAYVQA